MQSSSRPVVAAFDLDGTLTDGGSVFPWLCRVAGTPAVYRAALRRSAPLAYGALASGDAADRVKESLFTLLLRGRPMKDVAATSASFATQHLALHGRSSTISKLEDHLRQGHHVVIVSASPTLYVDEVANILHAHGSVATRLAVDPLGNLTGGYLGQNCRGEEKLRRLHEWIDEQHYDQVPEIFAYGNSRGDHRMLRGADHGHNAGKLGRWGALRSFERIS